MPEEQEGPSPHSCYGGGHVGTGALRCCCVSHQGRRQHIRPNCLTRPARCPPKHVAAAAGAPGSRPAGWTQQLGTEPSLPSLTGEGQIPWAKHQHRAREGRGHTHSGVGPWHDQSGGPLLQEGPLTSKYQPRRHLAPPSGGLALAGQHRARHTGQAHAPQTDARERDAGALGERRG